MQRIIIESDGLIGNIPSVILDKEIDPVSKIMIKALEDLTKAHVVEKQGYLTDKEVEELIRLGSIILIRPTNVPYLGHCRETPKRITYYSSATGFSSMDLLLTVRRLGIESIGENKIRDLIQKKVSES